MTTHTHQSDLETIVTVIARSPIVVTEPGTRFCALPPGFDAVDIAILEWIVAESRRTERAATRM